MLVIDTPVAQHASAIDILVLAAFLKGSADSPLHIELVSGQDGGLRLSYQAT